MYRLIRTISIILTVSLTAIMLSGCSVSKKNHHLVSDTGFYFDTVIQISIAHEQGESLLNDCFSMCQEFEKIFSKTAKDSELYQVNHRTANEVEISEHLANVIEIGLYYGELTDGAFDITICPLTDLWDFKSETPVVPDALEIQEALLKVDYKKVHLNDRILLFDSQDTTLDLGAIAKGYAADCLKDFLIEAGVESGYINLGGNVLTIGMKEDGSSWKIGIQEPFENRGTVLSTVESDGQSVVSSGIYERYFEFGDTLYHHVIDPKTGYPVEAEMDQITVVSDKSVIGDAVSTSCLLLGETKGQELLEKIGFSNVWLHLNDRCVMIKQ